MSWRVFARESAVGLHRWPAPLMPLTFRTIGGGFCSSGAAGKPPPVFLTVIPDGLAPCRYKCKAALGSRRSAQRRASSAAARRGGSPPWRRCESSGGPGPRRMPPAGPGFSRRPPFAAAVVRRAGVFVAIHGPRVWSGDRLGRGLGRGLFRGRSLDAVLAFRCGLLLFGRTLRIAWSDSLRIAIGLSTIRSPAESPERISMNLSLCGPVRSSAARFAPPGRRSTTSRFQFARRPAPGCSRCSEPVHADFDHGRHARFELLHNLHRSSRWFCRFSALALTQPPRSGRTATDCTVPRYPHVGRASTLMIAGRPALDPVRHGFVDGRVDLHLQQVGQRDDILLGRTVAPSRIDWS